LTDIAQTKYNSEKSNKIQRNKTTLVQWPLTTLGRETRCIGAFYDGPKPTRALRTYYWLCEHLIAEELIKG